MIIDLIKEQESSFLLFDIGDILIFSNGEEHDYYQVIIDYVNGKHYKLLSLKHGDIREGWNSLEEMIKDNNGTRLCNGFKLAEVLKPDEVVIRRVANE